MVANLSPLCKSLISTHKIVGDGAKFAPAQFWQRHSRESYNAGAFHQQASHRQSAAAAFRQLHQNIGPSYQARTARLSQARQNFSC
jgi:hypothetical protein